jgi:hypothetical protein
MFVLGFEFRMVLMIGQSKWPIASFKLFFIKKQLLKNICAFGFVNHIKY